MSGSEAVAGVHCHGGIENLTLVPPSNASSGEAPTVEIELHPVLAGLRVLPRLVSSYLEAPSLVLRSYDTFVTRPGSSDSATVSTFAATLQPPIRLEAYTRSAAEFDAPFREDVPNSVPRIRAIGDEMCDAVSTASFAGSIGGF